MAVITKRIGIYENSNISIMSNSPQLESGKIAWNRTRWAKVPWSWTTSPRKIRLSNRSSLTRSLCAGNSLFGGSHSWVWSIFHGRWYLQKRYDARVNDKTCGIIHPTPWNHLEAGILFRLGLPLLVFRESGIQGGIFDPGVTDVFVNQMPPHDISQEKRQELREVFLKWQSKVREHYYRDIRD